MLKESDLHGYQAEACQHIIDNPFCALFLEMGLGKTISTLTAIKKLIDGLDVGKVLIIAPKRVAESVWDAEIDKWEHIHGLTVSKVIGTPKQRLAALNSKADIYLLGRDNVSWLVGLYGGSMLPFDMLVIDEFSSFKNAKSQRFKALRGVQPSFSRVVGLTGTPAPNGLIDLWAPVYLLDRGQRLGKFISRFREEYFRPGASNGHIVYKYNIRKDGEQRIYDAIGDICMSMKAEDYLKLPERINNYIDIRFPDDLQKKYNDFEKEKVLQLFTEEDDDNDISAMNAAALSNKLLQFANGAVYDEDKVTHEVHKLKLDAAEDIIEVAQGKPILIFYTYQSDRDRLLERLAKYEPRVLGGDQDIRDWNAGKVQVLMMHPASGGHGLNLQAGGNIVIWFGQTWSLELYQQANARLDRQGQTQSVIIHHLVASKTIDQDVIKALENKSNNQEGLMQAVKARLKKYLK